MSGTKTERIDDAVAAEEFGSLIPVDRGLLVSMVVGPCIHGSGILVGARDLNGTPIGLAWALRTSDPQTFYFSYIVVHEGYRDQHVAEALDTKLVELAKREGGKWAFGLSHPGNKASNTFLVRSGWLLLGEAPRFYGRGEPRNLYWKCLGRGIKGGPPADSSFWTGIYGKV